MAAPTLRRLPGIRFETAAPPPVDVLPRMDVPVFVGFTASGPLQVPVAVADPAHFTAIFGADAPLAWDAEQGEVVYAYLAPAVRAFFRNNGQRCWVLRVAGSAQSNYFPIPGLACLRADGSVTPAFAPARSEGSWTDGLRVAAAVDSQLIPTGSILPAQRRLGLQSEAGNAVAVGDLLRLTFAAEGYVQLFAVRALEAPPANQSPPAGDVLYAQGGPDLWLRPAGWIRPGAGTGQLRGFTHAGPGQPLPVLVPQSVASPPAPNLDWPQPADADQTVRLNVPGTLAGAPAPGSLVQVDFGAEPFWMLVTDVRAMENTASPLNPMVQLTGPGFWQLKGPPSPMPSPSSVERLTFELWIHQDGGNPAHLGGLGFAAGHPYFWGALPTDAALYAGDAAAGQTAYPDLWRTAAEPRFPLAGAGDGDLFTFPLAMPLLPDLYLGPELLPATALERDGLEHFGEGLFLGEQDPAALQTLLEAPAGRLLAEADFLRYQGPAPRPLAGIYAALALEEATLIAVPDAVHRGWFRQTPAAPPPPSLPPSPNGSGARPFAACVATVVPAPALTGSTQNAPDGTFSLAWTTVTGDHPRYTLEEATWPDYRDATVVYTGPGDRLDIYGRRPGDYYYRVSAAVNGVGSEWSNGVVVRVAPARDWRLNPTEKYRADALLVIHRALLRLCPARGDLFAVLALPGHFREDDAINHVFRLGSQSGPALPVSLGNGATPPLAPPPRSWPLSPDEVAALSFAAVYHPWLIGREESQPEDLRRTPPDGAVCGVLARRANARGAWIAAANEQLAGVADLSPAVARDRWLDLLTAQVNLVRQEPRGFLMLSADTLSPNDALRPISVRRLLSLLRRLALSLGTAYVFEPNDDAFRRSVQQGFEGIMEFLFARGAFAGRTPAAAYQVVTGNGLNTPQDMDQGRFVVDLRVAPSHPLTFLTVRLVQTGDQSVVTEIT